MSPDRATPCLFASDLHGHLDRYRRLLAAIEGERPAAVFLGGDLLPSALTGDGRDFLVDVLGPAMDEVRGRLGADWPRVFVILGNDDARSEEPAVRELESRGLWEYVHGRKVAFGRHFVYGYAMVPPTPFRLKDWERYDVSRYVDPGCCAPDEGMHTVAVSEHELTWSTIAEELAHLAGDDDLADAILLCHSPPYQTLLDRAALDGQSVDHVPLDVHVGSIALRRFLEARQPLLALHGHVHESARLTGSWRDTLRRTYLFSAAHDGPELALVRFDPAAPGEATRELV